MNDLFNPQVRELPFRLPEGDGYGATWNEERKGFDIIVPDGWLFYSEHFFNSRWTERVVEYLQENDLVDWRTAVWRDIPADDLEKIHFCNINWKQDHIKLYGKNIPLPRLTAWYGDPDKVYTYSGIKSQPNQWNEGLLHIKERIERIASATFNSVLLNWYRDGRDCLSWHADDEKELGSNPTIASANFGAERDFLIRRNCNQSEKLNVPLRNGTLLIMGGSLQHHWQHSIPKRSGIKESRFNLTFRKIGV